MTGNVEQVLSEFEQDPSGTPPETVRELSAAVNGFVYDGPPLHHRRFADALRARQERNWATRSPRPAAERPAPLREPLSTADHEEALRIDEALGRDREDHEHLEHLNQLDERIDSGGAEARDAEEQLNADPKAREWLFIRDEFCDLSNEHLRHRRVRGRGPRLSNRRGTSRARRSRPGRRRSATARSGSDSDPPGGPEGEEAAREIADLKTLSYELVEQIEELEAEIEHLRGES